MENQLLDTKALQDELSNLISKSKEIAIVNAYVTDSAIDWMLAKLPNDSTICVVARLSPQDLISSSSTFGAIRKLLNNGHEIRLLANLHAKIYLIDNKYMFVGSANLTNNGLKLFGNGNIEASTRAQITPDALNFIDNIRTTSIEITFDVLERMEQAIQIQKSKSVPLQWDDKIIAQALDLWTVDMLQEEINTPNIINENDKILLFGNEEYNAKNIEYYFKKSKLYKWLINELQEDKNQSLSFGSITAKLHRKINDDPAPYRKSIKQYVKSLLSYCKIFALNEVEISRLNYSETIKLK